MLAAAERGEFPGSLAYRLDRFLRNAPTPTLFRPVRCAVADRHPEVHDPSPAERGEHRVVERGARGHVSTLDGKVINHEAIVTYPPPSPGTGPGPVRAAAALGHAPARHRRDDALWCQA